MGLMKNASGCEHEHSSHRGKNGLSFNAAGRFHGCDAVDKATAGPITFYECLVKSCVCLLPKYPQRFTEKSVDNFVGKPG
jgi:hypothetical protein